MPWLMSTDELFDATIRHRYALVGRLSGLSDEEWNRASLCAGWRVRDVVGHLISILERPTSQFLTGGLKHRGLHGAMDEFARETGARTIGELLDTYRSLADRRFKPPMVGAIAPLADLLVHTRDIERPLGYGSRLEPESVRTVLDFLVSGRSGGFAPRKRVINLRFEATDIEWWAGNGPLLSGPGEALMMAMCGRGDAVNQLIGNGIDELNRRLSPKVPRV